MSLPIIRGSSQALYPFKLSYMFSTLVNHYQNGSEQRCVRAPGRVRFELPYQHLKQAQKNSVFSGVAASRGQEDTTITITLGMTTYTGLSLDSDTVGASEGLPLVYEAPLSATQAIPQNLSPGTSGQPFPTLTYAPAQRPYLQRQTWQTVVTEIPNSFGAKWTYSEFGPGPILQSYPTGALMSWEWTELSLSDADVATRVAHYIANYGMAYTFQFTDPDDSSVHSKVRYNFDTLVVQYNGIADTSIAIQLQEVF